MQLELINEQSMTYSQDQGVIFDTLVSPPTSAISYDTETGVITLNERGTYHINWWIATESVVGEKRTLDFSLITSTGQKIEADSPNATTQLTGIGNIQVESTPITVKLVNTGNNTVTLGVYSTPQAALYIVQIKEAVAPVGIWQSAGLYMLNKEPQAGVETTIPSGGLIPFDNMRESFNGVTYSNGQVHITSTGYYLFNWQVIGRPSETGKNIILQLEDTLLIPEVYGKSASVSNDYESIIGNALVLVESIPLAGSKDFQLVNRSSGAITLASAYNTEGDLSIHYSGALTALKIGDLYWS